MLRRIDKIAALFNIMVGKITCGIACWIERWTHDWKVASLNPCRSGRRMFFSRVNFVCCLLFSVRSTPELPWWHIKDPGHCQKCRWQVTPKHMYTLDPSKSEWADYATVQAECGNLSGNELTRNSSGNTGSQSSQLARPLWTDPGLNSPAVPAGIRTRNLSIQAK